MPGVHRNSATLGSGQLSSKAVCHVTGGAMETTTDLTKDLYLVDVRLNIWPGRDKEV